MKPHYLFLLVLFIGISPRIMAQSPLLGANYNHDPGLIDLDLLKRSQAGWVRTTPRFYKYLDSQFDPVNDLGLQKVIAAKEAGYKVIFGFRFDFKMHKERIPMPGSEREQEIFQVATQILNKLAPSIDIFTLGNEPILETLSIDMVYQDKYDGIPLLVFTERLLSQVVEKVYTDKKIELPQIYTGSIHAIFENGIQINDATNAMLRFTKEDDRIAGIDLHFHINSFDEVDNGFRYARSVVKDKPFIVTEFSLHRLYCNKLEEPVSINKEGRDFVQKYGYSPEMKNHQWYTEANSHQVSPREFSDFFSTRSWFIPGYLNVFKEKFNKYGVDIATYPILQQFAPKVVKKRSAAWFLNPVFMQVSLQKNQDGRLGANPLCYDDYINWAKTR